MLRLLGHGTGTPTFFYELGATEYVRCVLKLSDRCLWALDLEFPIFFALFDDFGQKLLVDSCTAIDQDF